MRLSILKPLLTLLLFLLAAPLSAGCGDDTTAPPKQDTGVTDVSAPKPDQAAVPDVGAPDEGAPDVNAPDVGLPDTSAPDQAQSCTTCHGTPPSTGKHVLHSGLGQKCSGCHSEVVDDAMTIIAPLLHKNGIKNVKGSFTWKPSTRTCSNVGCHVDRVWP